MATILFEFIFNIYTFIAMFFLFQNVEDHTYSAFRASSSEKSPFMRLEKILPDKFLEKKDIYSQLQQVQENKIVI